MLYVFAILCPFSSGFILKGRANLLQNNISDRLSVVIFAIYVYGDSHEIHNFIIDSLLLSCQKFQNLLVFQPE